MYNTIVVGTDASATAEKAVTQACQLASISGAALHIAMVTPTVPIVVSPEAVMAAAPYAEAGEQLTNSTLEVALAKASEHAVNVTTHALQGDPADALLTLCEDLDADLLVIGNRGMRGAKRFLLGSVSNRCAHHAPCSILIVHTS
jgi:nucleotide-binding universal stress UspA family protein